MIRLHYSNRLEELIAPLAGIAREEQGIDPLRRVTIVVPSRVIEEFLKLRLAEREGIAANLGFPFLRSYLARIAEQASDDAAEPAIKVLDAGGLHIAVFEYLRKALDVRQGDLAPVQAYLAAVRDDARQRALRLFQLSARVAWLMREYSISRRAMLERWLQGATLVDEQLVESERWQSRIYLSLFGRDGSLQPEWIAAQAIESNARVRWMLLPFAFGTLDDERLRKVLPPRLHVFGIGYAGPEFIRIFARLGELTDLHLYTLNPCREFWEDVRERRATRPPRVGTLIESAEDPFSLDAANDNLALRYWGRAGREYVRLLNELTECDFDSHFIEPAREGRRATLLERVQQAILTRSPEQGNAANADRARSTQGVNSSAEDDGSIRFLECPGVRREVEIAADAIWSLIRRDAIADHMPAAAPLRFHQIAIVIPEAARDQYLAHLESVFSGAHRIPVNIVDRRFAAQSRVAEAVDLLLKLPLGRFTRDEMVRLLAHPAVAGADGEPHAELWPEWCRRLGVRFGADERAFEGTYVEPKLYHWDYALKRLALGLFMAGEPGNETRVFSAANGREYLPFEVVEDEAEAAAVMIRKARALIRDAQALAESELVLADWRRVLIEMVATYVNPAERAGERVRDLILSAIDSMCAEGIRSDPVPYEVACELVRVRIAEAASAQGTYAESGVVVGSLAAMRSIPFRVVFMLGLGEADFPERERRDPLDLRQAYRRAGDVSPAERDRYMFLETLLAARERIFLSYVARNAHTGEPLEPSPVIRDLQFILRGMIGDEAVKRLSLAHPVSAHDRRYFADLALPQDRRDDRLETFDRNARRDAQIAALRADLDSRCGAARNPADGENLLEQLGDEARAKLSPVLRLVEPPSAAAGAEDSRVRLSIAALRRYLECPLQGAARHALGMNEEDDGDGEEADQEPIKRSRLDEAMLLREALWRARGNPEEIADCYDEVYRSRILMGAAPVGLFADAARTADAARLRLAIDQANAAGVPNLALWQRIAVGGVEEFTEIERSIDPIILQAGFTRPDGRRVTSIELRGRIGPLSPRLDKSFKLIVHGAAKTTDFLEGCLAAIVLAAAGEKMPPEFIAIVAGGEDDKVAKYTRTIRPPSQAEAREYLARVAGDLLGNGNDYFLPIEAVEAVLRDKDQTAATIAKTIGAIRDNKGNTCRSDFGPVRDARNFRVPLDEIRDGLIERRYGPLMRIFAVGRGREALADD